MALAGKKKYGLYDNLLIADAAFDFSRLAYTRLVYDFLFMTKASRLNARMAKQEWHKSVKSPFCIRVFGADKNLEPQLAALVWDGIRNPRVDLQKPRTSIHIFFYRNMVIAGILRQAIDQQGFEKRRPHMRPAMHPSSLHPRLARAMVNLTGIRKGLVIDPFCGTGGILIEAGLIGLRVEGHDIENEMLAMAAKNLDSFKVKYALKKQDATKLSKMLGYVVTDLPYGKATKSQDMKKLYSGFFSVLKKHLHKKAVIGTPSFIDSRSLLKNAKLKVEKEFTYYMHKSLSKKIFVISS